MVGISDPSGLCDISVRVCVKAACKSCPWSCY